ncbi:glycosyltransferase family 2 protein [Microbacterium caowuchunii]|uniref:Glycosyltransferase family 2 protein n=1 Tax=Microbacterium caowuchunii TaxID=2614638 RepID=A0A5N0TK31_9MICO|nr:glycosyltransferase family 2 protein [Microbacterium caowuchunii]KAA9135533.1 glycosyltransferase family 2 protein [Microbacterium caowuchunii]
MLDDAGGVRRVLHRSPSPAERTPTVTVVIPCYNYARYVGSAIDSALTQAGVITDVIVVDDCSTDGSPEVVAAVAEQNPRVRLLRNDRNLGPVGTFNAGLELATGEFLVRLDADDLLAPGALQRATALADAFPSVGLVYGHPLHFSGTTLPSPRLRSTRWTVWPGTVWLEERCRTALNVITSPEVVMRRSVVDAVGGQRELAHTHDMEMWLRIAAVSDVGYLGGADQAWHREHAASLSQSLDPRFGDIRDRRDAFETLFAWAQELDLDTAVLRRLARQALVDEAFRAIVHMYDRNKVDAALLESYLAFLAELGPRVSPHAAEAYRLIARGQRRPTPWQHLRAIGRRSRSMAERARWHRRGVYTRDRRVSLPPDTEHVGGPQ